MRYLHILAFLLIPISGSPLELSLNQCIELTFQHNNTLKSKEASLKSAEYSYYASLNTYYPKFSLSGGFSRSGSDNRNPSNSFSASASLSQNIFNYNSIYSIKTAKINYELALLDYENYLITLRRDLYTAFYNLYFAQKMFDTNEKIVEIRKSNAELIELKYQSGFESKGNMLYAKAQYEMAKLNFEKARLNIKNASNNLKNIIGLDTDDDIKIKGEYDIENLSFDPSHIDTHLKNLPQYKTFLKNIELYNEKIKNAEMDWLPSLSFSASRSFSGKEFFPENKSWSFGLSLSIPIFSSGITYRKNNIEIARNGLEKIKQDFNDFIISQKNSILNAYSDYTIALSMLKTYQIFLEANEERFKEAQIKYLSGKMGYIDLENIEQNLIDARQNINDYTKAVFIKKINLDYLIGIKLERGGKK